MKKMLVYPLIAVILLTSLPALAEGNIDAIATLGEAGDALAAAETLDAQLKLLSDISSRFADELETDGWDAELNAPLADSAPEGFMPTDGAAFESAVDADALPEELRGLKILPLYDDDGTPRLLGDFAVRMPEVTRVCSLAEAEAVLLLRHSTIERTDYSGKAFDRHYALYIWKLGADEIYRFYDKKTTPPAIGQGTLYGATWSMKDLWREARALLLEKLTVSDASGALIFSVTGKNCFLSAIDGDRTELNVPAEVEGHPVAMFAKCDLAASCPSLEKVTLPRGLTRIDDNAFRGCKALRSVDMPDTLASVGNGAFFNCESMKAYDFPEGLETLGDEAIVSWRLLAMERVTLPSTLRSIGKSFLSGGGVFWLIVPEGIAALPDGFLKDSPNTFYVYIPASVQTFGAQMFGKCVTIYTPKGSKAQSWAEEMGVACAECDSPDEMPRPTLQTQGDFEYVIHEGEANLVRYAGEDADVFVPSELGGCPVRTVMESAFYQLEFIISITLPDSVTSLQDGAIMECGKLGGSLDVFIPASVQEIDKFAVHMGASTQRVHTPEGSVAQEWALDAYKKWVEWQP